MATTRRKRRAVAKTSAKGRAEKAKYDKARKSYSKQQQEKGIQAKFENSGKGNKEKVAQHFKNARDATPILGSMFNPPMGEHKPRKLKKKAAKKK